MKIIKNILIAALLVLISPGIINAQEVQVNADTSQVKLQQREQQQEQVRSKTQDGQAAQSGSQQQASNNKQSGAQGANTSGVKKIQGARPDWSKARGARPASVERPSGSRIPKGAGKPGGARGPGRR